MRETNQLRPDRRAVITAALTSASVSVVASCSRPQEPTAPSDVTARSPNSATGSTSTSSSTPTQPSLSPPVAWRPHENEVEVQCKLTAVHQVVAALTVDGGGPGRSIPSALRPLRGHVEGVEESVVEVVYPQYGGLSRDRRQASVMIVLNLVAIANGSSTTTSTSMTIDVRLRRRDSWRVTEVIIPKDRQRAAKVPDEAKQLLRSRQLGIPREARLDLASGRIDPKLMELMVELSQRWHLGVHVLRTGHPSNVFGTERTSNHTKGRAVDLWALDRIPVIAHDRAPWRDVMEAAAGLGADEIGGPVDIGDPGPPYFTNDVHQDHLHVAFEN